MLEEPPRTGRRFYRLLFTVFFPFALGHFLSLFFRNINAVLTPYLTAEMPLGADRIGLLSSAYFLALALTQLPVGLSLDRWGPKRTQIVFLTAAVAGALLFAAAHDFLTLFVARALCGIGLSASFMTSVKAISASFDKSRIPLLIGGMIAVGGLGAMTATTPVEWALHAIGWRTLFLWLAGFIALAILTIACIVPRDESRAPPAGTGSNVFTVLLDVWRVPGFRNAISLMLISHTVAFGVQGLWLGRWAADVAHLDRAAAANVLFISMAGIVVGSLLVGAVGEWATRRGVPLINVAGAGVALFGVVQVAAACGLVSFVPALTVAFTVVGSIGGIEFALVSQSVPRHLTGRASTLLNLFIFLGSFIVQTVFGLILDCWTPSADLRYPTQAYSAAFGILILLQLPGLIRWYLQRESSRFFSEHVE